MKTALQGVGGLLLSVILLYWVFHDKDPQALSAALLRASWPALFLAAVVNFAHNGVRVLRWRFLLDPVRQAVPFRPMFAAVILGIHDNAPRARAGGGTGATGLAFRAPRPSARPVSRHRRGGPPVWTASRSSRCSPSGVWGPISSPGRPRWRGRSAAAAVFALGLIVLGLADLGGDLDAWAGDSTTGCRAAQGPVRWIGRATLSLSRGVDALRSPRRVGPILLYSLARCG